MTRLLTSVAAAALLALPAFAQAPTTTAPNANQGKPPSPAAEGTMQKAPDATKPSDMTQKPAAAPQAGETAAKLNAADRNFVETAASAGKAEVEAGKLASDKARNPAVKDFAKMMVDDHSKANDKLMTWAKENKFEPSKDMKVEHKRGASTLSGQSGAQFDRMYMDSQLQEHQKAVQLFTHQSTAGQNMELKQFAAETLPTLQQHLKMAQQIVADMNKTATGDKPAGTTTGKSATRAKSADSTLEQGSTDRDVGAIEPAAGKRKAAKTARSAQRGSDSESARIAELNRQQLQQIEGPQRR
jgi:putative membrane protein